MTRFRAERSAVVAGQFYPGRRESLVAAVTKAAQAPTKVPPGRVRAMIVPHAGYQYSGAAAGEAYALLAARRGIKRVLVIAPSHHLSFQTVSVGCFSSFDTPLGKMSVDVTACERLLESGPLFSCRADAHEREHALEVQLPFLQTLLPDAELVPAVCGQLGASDIAAAGRILHEQLWREDTLWVISSDFTHYGDYFNYVPFKGNVDARLEDLDRGAIRTIQATDPDAFLDYVQQTGATICGAVPIGVLLAAARQVDPLPTWELITYITSGRLTHDRTHSVSYASIVGLDEDSGDDQGTVAKADYLTPADKSHLLDLARSTIAEHLGDPAPMEVCDAGLSPALHDDGAAFVTLHKAGNLRGCIGNLKATGPLFMDVIENARNAAFRDPRFPPVKKAELAQIDIEISVLTPPRDIKSLDEFEIGRHGIILAKGAHRAVFLPQVAPEQGWDVETTLTHLALKAGMRPDGWRRGASFQVFEAIVFGEKNA